MSAEERQIEPENRGKSPAVDQATKAKIIAALQKIPLQKLYKPQERAIPSTLPENRATRAKVMAALKPAKTSQKSGEIREYQSTSIGEALQYIQDDVVLGKAMDHIFSDSKNEIIQGLQELTDVISILEKLNKHVADEIAVGQIIARFRSLLSEILDAFDRYVDKPYPKIDFFHTKTAQTYKELAAFIDGLTLGNRLTPEL